MKLKKWYQYADKMGIGDIVKRGGDKLAREVINEVQGYDHIKFVERWKAYHKDKKMFVLKNWLKWLKQHIKLERLSRALLKRSIA